MLDAGTSSLESGTLAREIYDNLVAEFGTPEDDAVPAWTGAAVAIANAVVSHFTDNAEITVSVTPSDDALQRFDAGAGAAPTLGPSTTRTIEGTIA